MPSATCSITVSRSPSQWSRTSRWSFVFLLMLGIVACGSPTRPEPPPPPPPPPPPVNNPPTIESIVVQGTRRNEPPGFADVDEIVPITAAVRDDETAVDRLQYTWTATTGAFTGTGARVSWRAPASTATPTSVTLTLEVVELYGVNLQHRVTRTAAVALHNSVKEVGDMARQFLLDFSDTNIKDAAYIMRNFGTAATCPQPNEIVNELNDVVNHFTNYRMMAFMIGQPSVTVNFGGSCPFRGKLGDACAVTRAYWDSIDLRTNVREAHDGNDIIAAAYSRNQSRWWLCASDYQSPPNATGTALRRYPH